MDVDGKLGAERYMTGGQADEQKEQVGARHRMGEIAHLYFTLASAVWSYVIISADCEHSLIGPIALSWAGVQKDGTNGTTYTVIPRQIVTALG